MGVRCNVGGLRRVRQARHLGWATRPAGLSANRPRCTAPPRSRIPPLGPTRPVAARKGTRLHHTKESAVPQPTAARPSCINAGLYLKPPKRHRVSGTNSPRVEGRPPPPWPINTLIPGLRSMGGGLLDTAVPEVFTKYGGLEARFVLNTAASAVAQGKPDKPGPCFGI